LADAETARRRRARRLVLDLLFVSAGNEHVKHVLQASDSRSNAATQQAAAAAARVPVSASAEG